MTKTLLLIPLTLCFLQLLFTKNFKYVRLFLYSVRPFLDQTRPYSPPYVSAAENISLHLQLTVNANPTPTIEWKFRTQADWDSCNFKTIVSNTTTNRFLTSSSVLIDDEQSDIFGEYTFSANNTVGTFFRRFVVMKEGEFYFKISKAYFTDSIAI